MTTRLILPPVSLMVALLAASGDGESQTSRAPLRLVAEIPLPGGVGRFDYQSLDPSDGRLYIAQMGAGRLLVFDTKTDRVISSLAGLPPGDRRAGGAYSLHRVYASAAGRHELVVLESPSLRVRTESATSDFPTGSPTRLRRARSSCRMSPASGTWWWTPGRTAESAWSPWAGRRETPSTTRWAGESGWRSRPGTSWWPSIPRRTASWAATISPAPTIPTVSSLMRRTGWRSSPARGMRRLLVFDLTSLRVTESYSVGDDPDVLAFDPGLAAAVRGGGVGRGHRFQQRGRGAAASGRVPGTGGALGVGRSGNSSGVSAAGERGRTARAPDPLAPVT